MTTDKKTPRLGLLGQSEYPKTSAEKADSDERYEKVTSVQI